VTPTGLEATRVLADECAERAREIRVAVKKIQSTPDVEVCGPGHWALVDCMKVLAGGQVTLLHCREADYRKIIAESEMPNRNGKDALIIGKWRIPPLVLWLLGLIVVAIISSGRLYEVIEALSGLLHRK